MSASPSLATVINSTMATICSNPNYPPGDGSQSVAANPAGLFTNVGSFNTTCVSTIGSETLIAPYFALEAYHQNQGGGTFGGVTYGQSAAFSRSQQVFVNGGKTDLAVLLLASKVTTATPAEVLPSDYSAYIQPSAEYPVYIVRGDQNRQLALSDWTGAETITGDSGELEEGFASLPSTDPLLPWGTEPDTGAIYPIQNDSGNGVFAFFDVQGVPQTVLLGGIHYGYSTTLSTCSDVGDYVTAVNSLMASMFEQAQAQGLISPTEPLEQLTTVDLSGFAQVPSLKVQGFQGTTNVTQSLTYTVTVNTATGVSVPDGESVTLEDADNHNTVVGTGTFAGNVANITLAPGVLADGSHALFAAYAGDTNLGSSVSNNELSVAVLPQVTGVLLNGNIPALDVDQNSMVDSIEFTFSEPVNCGAGAFSINLDCNAEVNGTPTTVGTLPTLGWAAVNPNADGSSSQWAVTFSGNGVEAGSIANGIYDITANGYAITSDANPAVQAQGQGYLFWRLYGDYYGTGTVGFPDELLLSQDYGDTSSSPTYLVYMDIDGSGTIGFPDLLGLGQDYNTSYSV